MNADRRKRIAALSAKLEEVKSQLEGLRDDEADSIKNEEQEAFDNLSEGLQQSERGQQSEAAADALDSAHGAIEEAASYLDDAISSYQEAIQ